VEKINSNQGIQEETVRRSYQTPQLISLGEIQSLIQMGCGNGADACEISCAS
jgi:hypothetical protein